MQFLTPTWFIVLAGIVLVWLGWTWGRSERKGAMAREHSTDAMSPYRKNATSTTTGEGQVGQGQAQHKHHGGCC
jgi:hypothetical protein